MAALRASLDKRAERLRVVFTGSSREGLAAMFSARQAPFFHFATPIVEIDRVAIMPCAFSVSRCAEKKPPRS